MSHLNAIAINITLDDQNYWEWAFSVETALRGYGLAFHLTNDPPTLKTDGSNATELRTWEINDGKVMAAIVNSVKKYMIMSLSPFKKAKAMWSYLQQRYVQDSGALLHTLMQRIHSIEQNDMSIDEYNSAFESIMGPLLSMVPQCTADGCPTHKFIEKFLTYRFVMGVRADFEYIRTRLLHNSSTVTMAQALSDLIAEETRLKTISVSNMTVPHSVLVASQKFSTSRGKSSEPCEYCQKTGHRSEHCFAKYPEKLAEYRARRATRGRGPTSTPNGSVSVAAVSSIGASKSSWVLDSGASFHVTSDQTQLFSCKPVSDDTSVQIADGSSKRDRDWDWPSP